jgi:hypothetical protein
MFISNYSKILHNLKFFHSCEIVSCSKLFSNGSSYRNSSSSSSCCCCCGGIIIGIMIIIMSSCNTSIIMTSRANDGGDLIRDEMYSS